MNEKKRQITKSELKSTPSVRQPPAIEQYRAKQKEARSALEKADKLAKGIDTHKPGKFRKGHLEAEVTETGGIILDLDNMDPSFKVEESIIKDLFCWVDDTYLGWRAEADETIAGLRRVIKEHDTRNKDLVERMAVLDTLGREVSMELAELKEKWQSTEKMRMEGKFGEAYLAPKPERDDDPIHEAGPLTEEEVESIG